MAQCSSCFPVNELNQIIFLGDGCPRKNVVRMAELTCGSRAKISLPYVT